MSKGGIEWGHSGMKTYSIGLQNGLLDGKHMQALGQAVWLYMWLIDKQPKKTNKVSGGKPIKHADFANDFPQVTRRTYVRWMDALEKGGYISVLRTPRGLVITIGKSKKWSPSDAPKMSQHDETNVAHQKKSDAPKMSTDAPKMSHAEDAPKMSHPIKTNNLNKQRQTNNITDVMSGKDATDLHEKIKKLYYDCIKVYGLPVTNHNTLRSKIKAMCGEDDPVKILKYLEFMRDQYPQIELEFKPRIATALDFYSKRVQIREAIASELREQQGRRSNTVWRARKN